MAQLVGYNFNFNVRNFNICNLLLRIETNSAFEVSLPSMFLSRYSVCCCCVCVLLLLLLLLLLCSSGTEAPLPTGAIRKGTTMY